MKDELRLSGGISVLVKLNNELSYYYADNSTWCLEDWNKEIDDRTYFDFIKKYSFDTDLYSFETLNNNLPQLIIDFDNLKLISNYYDQPLEEKILENWIGSFIPSREMFFQNIPETLRYWEPTMNVKPES